MIRAFATTVVFLLCMSVRADPPMTPAQAFDAAKSFGTGQLPIAKGTINPGRATTSVPGYTTTTPETSYFGTPGLGTPAGARVTTCSTSVLDHNQYDDQSCIATNFTQRNPTVRPTITINSSDPVLTNSKPITSNPVPIAGPSGGTYSGCTVVNSKTPDVFQKFYCNEYLTREVLNCQKNLNVVITQNALTSTQLPSQCGLSVVIG